MNRIGILALGALIFHCQPQAQADERRDYPQAVPPLPGDAGQEAPNQTPPEQETVIPQPGAMPNDEYHQLPDDPHHPPQFNEDVVPRSTRPERDDEYGEGSTEPPNPINPDVIPEIPMPYPMEPEVPEDILPAPDGGLDGRYDPLETKLEGGTKPAPKQPEGSGGVPPGGYFKPF